LSTSQAFGSKPGYDLIVGLPPAIRDAYRAEIERLRAEQVKESDPAKSKAIGDEIAELEAELIVEDWPMFDD